LIQTRNHALLQRGGEALVELLDAIVGARAAGVAEDRLNAARELQRKAQWRLDFIAAENSMGFHAPQEAARILAEAIDYARQGHTSVLLARGPSTAASVASGAAPATP
jgi:nitrite reductase (cytochrome c-552)